MRNENKTIKGLSSLQHSNILLMVKRIHKFAAWRGENAQRSLKLQYPNINESVLAHGYSIKYTDSSYDSRTNEIWSVNFRHLGISFRTNNFIGMNVNMPPYDNLHDWLIDYLLGNWSPSEDQLKVMKYN